MTEPQTTPTPSTGPDAEASPTQPVDLEALIAKAKAATPGPWRAEPDPNGPGGTCDVAHTTVGDPEEEFTTGWVAEYIDPNDAAYIAAASPDVVLSLCDEIKRLRASSEDAVGAAELGVGRYVYRRIEALMNSKSGTPEAEELCYLASIAEHVEEYGDDKCGGDDLRPQGLSAGSLTLRASSVSRAVDGGAREATGKLVKIGSMNVHGDDEDPVMRDCLMIEVDRSHPLTFRMGDVCNQTTVRLSALAKEQS